MHWVIMSFGNCVMMFIAPALQLIPLAPAHEGGTANTSKSDRPRVVIQASPVMSISSGTIPSGSFHSKCNGNGASASSTCAVCRTPCRGRLSFRRRRVWSRSLSPWNPCQLAKTSLGRRRTPPTRPSVPGPCLWPARSRAPSRPVGSGTS
jgi:hypothetical protein